MPEPDRGESGSGSASGGRVGFRECETRMRGARPGEEVSGPRGWGPARVIRQDYPQGGTVDAKTLNKLVTQDDFQKPEGSEKSH